MQGYPNHTKKVDTVRPQTLLKLKLQPKATTKIGASSSSSASAIYFSCI